MKAENKKLLKNVGALTIGNFASRFLGLLLIPFYTAVLSTAEYGISDLIITTTSLLFPFTSVAISEAIMRFALDKGTDKKSIYTSGLLIITAGYILLIAAFPIMQKTSLQPYLLYFYLYYGFYCLNTITSYFIKGIEKIVALSVSGIINTAVVVGCNLLFLLVFKIGIVGYLMSSIIGYATTFLFLFVKGGLYKYITSPRKLDGCLLKEMLKYSVVIIPNSLSWWIANSSDKYVLNYFVGTSDVGIYSVAYKIPTIIITITGIFVSAWHLSAVENFGGEKSKKFFAETYNKFFLLNIAMSAVLIVSSKLMAYFLYSDEFFVAYKYVPLLVVSCMFDGLASFMGSIYIAAKKSKMLSISTVLGAAINIALNFALIPQIGTIGAAISTAISYAFIFLVRIINTRSLLRFDINYFRDIILLLLLIVEIVLVTIDVAITIWISVFVFAICISIVVFGLRDNLKSAISIIKKYFTRRTKQND